MTLEELGLVLRAEREKKGQSIEEIADHLKIGVRLLRALEEGDSASLPHISYAKGFIKSYCHYLGLADEELQEAISSLSNNTIPNATESFANTKTAKPSSLSRLIPAFFLLIIAAGLLLAYQYDLPNLLGKYTQGIMQKAEQKTISMLSENGQAKNQNVQPRTEPSLVKQSPPDTPEPNQQQAAPPPPMTPEKETLLEVSRKDEQDDPPAKIDTAPQKDKTPLPEIAAPDQQVAVPSPHKVIISAVEECWIHSNADNSDTRQFSLRKGDTFALTFKTSLTLKLGNAGGVRIRFDGQDMGAPGQPGQVKTITFPISNQ